MNNQATAPSDLNQVSGAQLLEQAKALQHQGQLSAAIDLYQILLQNLPNHINLLHQLAILCLQLNRNAEAKNYIIRALNLDPSNSDFWNIAGVICQRLGQVEQARESFRRSIDTGFQAIGPLNNLGQLELSLGHLQTALNYFNEGLQIRSHNTDLLLNKSSVLRAMGEYDEALDILRFVIKSEPQNFGAHYNMGNIEKELGNFSLAIEAYKKCLAIQPEFHDAQAALSLIYLVSGNFREGFSLFEKRLLSKVYQGSPQPTQLTLWDGNKGWNGNKDNSVDLLITHEQGLGDQIHCLGLMERVVNKVNSIYWQVPEPLHSMLPDAKVHWILPGQIPEQVSHFCPVMSLFERLEISTEDARLPIPYLKTSYDNPICEKNKRAKIGLVWQGNSNNPTDGKRSVQLDEISSFIESLSQELNKETIELHCIQHVQDFSESDLCLVREWEKDYGLICHFDDIQNLADTAAIISDLDLLISVDTAVLHLAGALNIPAWGLIAKVNDWRWLESRDDSIWYPSIRLFRQEKVAGWENVLQRVKTELVQRFRL